MTPQRVHTIVMYPRPHPDPICALFLLREFGEQKFPGITKAKVEYWNKLPDNKTSDQLETEGYVLLDLGNGKFDHHEASHGPNSDCASTLVAKFLGVDQKPELKKLLQYVTRDDLEGRGIISKDPIDRAFGLSALIMNLNRDYPEHPDYVLETVYRIFLAHYHEEYRRKVLMPQEWESLQHSGKAKQFSIHRPERVYRIIMVESDSTTLVGFLRALKRIQADIVVQRRSSGHTNIITNQNNRGGVIDLRKTAKAIRQLEAQKQNISLAHYSEVDIEKPGRLPEVPQWYFDTAAKTLQNGGAASQGISPTHLSLEDIQNALTKSL